MGHSEKMEQDDNRPKWLLELENRKRKPRLAHEVGAGAPCMKCSTACPGLDLHFWRKICKNCKCSRDDHDVPNDEFPQFDLLFGPTGKSNRKMIVLKVNKKQSEAEITFEWAPPDTTKELAADYMKALPEDKLPIKGTAGAALRKQQLQRQLPLHDIDHKVCDELSESERKQFEKYLENLKKYVGQGKVIKAMGARPFDINLMTPANATDMNRFSPKHKTNVPESNHSLNLRTPSSFVKKMHFSSPHSPMGATNSPGNSPLTRETTRDHSPSSSSRLERVCSPIVENSYNENSSQGRYHRHLENIRNDAEISSSKPIDNRPNYTSNLTIPEKSTNHNNSSSNVDTKNSIDRQLLKTSFDPKNSTIINSNGVNGTLNPATEFATSNAMVNPNKSIISLQKDHENSKIESTNKTLNDSIKNCYSDQRHPITTEIHKVHGSTSAICNPEFGIPLGKNPERLELEKSSKNEFSSNNLETMENSLMAEKMLCEALKPPSAIHTSDIIGSTLDKKGLSFIREKLISKYSSREDAGTLQNPSRSRELRRQGAFDRDPERLDVFGDVKNPSQALGNDEGSMKNLEDSQASSSRTKMVHEGPTNVNSNDYRPNKNFSGTNFEEQSQNAGEKSYGQIMRGICKNYLTNSEKTKNFECHRDKNNSNFNDETQNHVGSSMDSTINDSRLCGEGIRAELASYGPGNSNLIRSECLHNQIFPEEAVSSSGIVQNSVNVDRLKGAMEELSMSHAKTQHCHQCREDVRPGDVVVTAERANDAVWHPGCFVCSQCNELLADLVYFYYKGKLYCGRDLATLLDIPRCFACDELIFVREYTVAEGHNYHVKHFCCWDCDVPLAGQQYISENDRPLCLLCYQRTYAQTCGTCEGLIAADQQGVAVKNLNFHATDACFCCASCKKSLLNGKMAIKEDRPFCSKECIAEFLNRPTA